MSSCHSLALFVLLNTTDSHSTGLVYTLSSNISPLPIWRGSPATITTFVSARTSRIGFNNTSLMACHSSIMITFPRGASGLSIASPLGEYSRANQSRVVSHFF